MIEFFKISGEKFQKNDAISFANNNRIDSNGFSSK